MKDPKSFRNLKVLLVEDNSINQLIARKMMRVLGHSLKVVGNGVEALEALALESYDVVLMDCQMPVMDGYETTRNIRENEKPGCQDLAVIAWTADTKPGVREKCLAAGMNGYLAKPVTEPELQRMIEKCLGKWAA